MIKEEKKEIIRYIKYLKKSQRQTWNRLVEMIGSVPRFKEETKRLKKWGQWRFK